MAKLTIVLGPIASGKTVLAKKLADEDECGTYIDVEKYQYEDGIMNIEFLWEYIIKFMKLNKKYNIYLDSWWEWKHWWWQEKPEMETLKKIVETTDCEVEFRLIKIKTDVVIDRIINSEDKYVYRAYETEIPKIYTFYETAISEFRKWLSSVGRGSVRCILEWQ